MHGGEGLPSSQRVSKRSIGYVVFLILAIGSCRDIVLYSGGVPIPTTGEKA
jgi:hypothetical protein